MRVALAGPTGLLGSHMPAELQEHGHQGTAPVRDEAEAHSGEARSATPIVTDLYDRTAVVGLITGAARAIHTASPGDATSADLENASGSRFYSWTNEAKK